MAQGLARFLFGTLSFTMTRKALTREIRPIGQQIAGWLVDAVTRTARAARRGCLVDHLQHPATEADPHPGEPHPEAHGGADLER